MDVAGMFVFWVLQTACFAVYSETGNMTAAHAFIAMICESPSALLVTACSPCAMRTQSCSTHSVSTSRFPCRCRVRSPVVSLQMMYVPEDGLF